MLLSLFFIVVVASVTIAIAMTIVIVRLMAPLQLSSAADTLTTGFAASRHLARGPAGRTTMPQGNTGEGSDRDVDR